MSASQVDETSPLAMIEQLPVDAIENICALLPLADAGRFSQASLQLNFMSNHHLAQRLSSLQLMLTRECCRRKANTGQVEVMLRMQKNPQTRKKKMTRRKLLHFARSLGGMVERQMFKQSLSERKRAGKSTSVDKSKSPCSDTLELISRYIGSFTYAHMASTMASLQKDHTLGNKINSTNASMLAIHEAELGSGSLWPSEWRD
jgi:hypothetical protein